MRQGKSQSEKSFKIADFYAGRQSTQFAHSPLGPLQPVQVKPHILTAQSGQGLETELDGLMATLLRTVGAYSGLLALLRLLLMSDDWFHD